MNKLIQRIAYKLARRKLVRGFDKYCKVRRGKALMYFKTEEFWLRGFFQDLSHPNNWESYQMAKLLNELGLAVDVLDRTATLKDIEGIKDEYDVFIGLGAGDSGQYFADIGERVPGAIKILYAMGPEPDLSNKITKERHDYFRRRHPEIEVEDRRMIKNVDTERLYKNTDAIITLGNDFSVGSYEHLGKLLHKVYLSTYTGLRMDVADFKGRSSKKFLYFGGNGNIVKGLDLVLEVFARRPELTLYIGAPQTEEDFNVFAEPIIRKSDNIKPLGFVDISGEEFKKITAECGYVIMPSASEGCATSVTTCMRRGLSPVVTKESGIERAEEFGWLIPEGTLEAVEKTVEAAANLSEEELLKKTVATYIESMKYTQANFLASLEEVLVKILHSRGKLKR